MSTSTSQALAERNEGPGALVEKYRSDFALVLPSHVNADQWVRVSQGLLRRDANLAKAAQANPGSFLSAMLECARLGLEPGDTFHLVPFGREIHGIRDYTGEIELIYRAGAVSSIKCEVVHANDVFEFDTTMAQPVHRPNWFGDRGPMIGVYAYAVMKDGSTSRVVVYSKAQVEEVKAISKNQALWNKWPDRMWRKTVVKQLRHWVPSSPEYREALLRSSGVAEQVAATLDLPAAKVDDAFDDDDDRIVDAVIVDDEPAPPSVPVNGDGERLMIDAQARALTALLRSKKNAVGPVRFTTLTKLLGRDITTMDEVTFNEAATLIEQLQDVDPDVHEDVA